MLTRESVFRYFYLGITLSFSVLAAEEVSVGDSIRGNGLAATNLIAFKDVKVGETVLCNEIDPVFRNFDEDFLGTICFSGNVAVQPCSVETVDDEQRTVQPLLLVNDIKPVKIDRNGKCVANDSGTTCFSATTAINPDTTLYVNEIDPVKTITDDKGCTKYVADSQGTTCFGGTVAIQSCGGTGSNSGLLLVNRIAPVKTVEETCVIDTCGTTGFGGNVALNQNTALWVNQINPVVSFSDDCTEYSSDDSCAAKTQFSGDLWVRNKHIFGQLNDVTISQAQTTDDMRTRTIRLHFDSTQTTPPIGAIIKLYFVGTGTQTVDTTPESFDVFYKDHIILSPDADNDFLRPLRGSQTSTTDGYTIPTIGLYTVSESGSGTYDVYIDLQLCSSPANTASYTGSLYYEIIAANDMTAIYCINESVADPV